jgi:hypothetical protein
MIMVAATFRAALIVPGILGGARELEANGQVPGMGPGIAAGLVIPRDENGGEGFN